MKTRWWNDLSDDELRTRLEQRDVDPAEVAFMVMHRDDVPTLIGEALGDD